MQRLLQVENPQQLTFKDIHYESPTFIKPFRACYLPSSSSLAIKTLNSFL